MTPHDAPRIRNPERNQFVLESCCLDSLLDSDHRVRLIWKFVESLDITTLLARIKSRPGNAGAPAISPRILLALWFYACLDNVASAREIERLCDDHIAFRWLCGRVNVNHHTLSDFRNDAGAALDVMLTDMIVALTAAKVVDAETLFQDGTKIRASAGSSSFRREPTLSELKVKAAALVADLKAAADDAGAGSRAKAARERAAREKHERITEALKVMEQMKVVKAASIKKKGAKNTSEPRASTTDKDARVMKMGSGGSHPAYNVQFGTDGKSRAIIGVQVLLYPCDNGMSEAMRLEVERRTGVKVKRHVTDAGYLSKPTTEREEMAGVERIMPLPNNKGGEPAIEDQPGDGPGVRRWRGRMSTEEAKALIRQRSGIAETPNAELKTYRALDRLLVRGKQKVTSVVLIGVLMYNLVHFATELVGRPMPAL